MRCDLFRRYKHTHPEARISLSLITCSSDTLCQLRCFHHASLHDAKWCGHTEIRRDDNHQALHALQSVHNVWNPLGQCGQYLHIQPNHFNHRHQHCYCGGSCALIGQMLRSASLLSASPCGLCQSRVRCTRSRRVVRPCASTMSGGVPEFGFVFDIDGVLIRGWDLLPNAKESLKKVHDSGVPYLFVTNNGMDTEDERAKILTKLFDIPVTNKSMVLNHSALQVSSANSHLLRQSNRTSHVPHSSLRLQNHANDFGDELVLVTGYSRTDLRGVLRSEWLPDLLA